MKLSSFLAGLFLVMALSGCKFNLNDGLTWDADILAPIATSTVTIGDAISDSSILAPGSDNLLSLVFRDSISSTSIGDFIEFPDTTVDLSLTLDSLSLDPGTIEQTVTLGEIARQLKSQGNIVGDLILASHNSTLPIPDVDGLTSGLIPVDATEFFEFADIQSGFLRLTIENELPVDIRNVQFLIQNSSGPPAIISDTFPTIQSKSSRTRDYDMTDKTIESTLSAELANLDIKGNTVKIDTNDFIKIILEAIDLKVKSATAVFPGQTVFDSLAETVFTFPQEFRDIELTRAIVESGRIEARTFSTIEDTVQFSYRLPSASRNGEVPEIALKINPAVNGVPDVQLQERDLAGFTLDLTVDGTTYNTILQQYTVDLVYSGKKISIDQNDSLFVSFGLLDIKPTYVEGYIGKEKFVFTGDEAIDLFDQIDVKRLNIVNPIGNITVGNSFGVDHQMFIKDVTAINSKTGQQVSLAGAPTRSNSGIVVPGPVFGDTFGVTNTPVQFSGENGNLDDFFNLMPDRLIYDLEINANYNGVPGVHDNFATNTSSIGTYVEFILPLEGIVEELSLQDSVELSFGQTDDQINQINGGLLRLIIDNQYPFEGLVSAYLYDRNWQQVDFLAENQVIKPGIPNAETGYVDVFAQTIIEKDFTRESLRKILDESAHLVLTYQLNTRPEGEPVKVYYDYFVKAQLVGEFSYQFDQ